MLTSGNCRLKLGCFQPIVFFRVHTYTNDAFRKPSPRHISYWAEVLWKYLEAVRVCLYFSVQAVCLAQCERKQWHLKGTEHSVHWVCVYSNLSMPHHLGNIRHQTLPFAAVYQNFNGISHFYESEKIGNQIVCVYICAVCFTQRHAPNKIAQIILS